MVCSVAVEHVCRLARLLARKAAIACVKDTTLVPARREETTDHNPELNDGRQHHRHHDNFPPSFGVDVALRVGSELARRNANVPARARGGKRVRG